MLNYNIRKIFCFFSFTKHASACETMTEDRSIKQAVNVVGYEVVLIFAASCLSSSFAINCSEEQSTRVVE